MNKSYIGYKWAAAYGFLSKGLALSGRLCNMSVSGLSLGGLALSVESTATSARSTCTNNDQQGIDTHRHERKSGGGGSLAAAAAAAAVAATTAAVAAATAVAAPQDRREVA